MVPTSLAATETSYTQKPDKKVVQNVPFPARFRNLEESSSTVENRDQVLHDFKENRKKAQEMVKKLLESAPTLGEYLVLASAYEALTPGMYDWILDAGPDYEEYRNASPEQWFQMATQGKYEAIKDQKNQEEVVRVHHLAKELGEIPTLPSAVKIIVARYSDPNSSTVAAYRVLAELPIDSDSTSSIPKLPTADSQATKFIYSVPMTGCTAGAISNVFKELPAETDEASIQIPDLPIEEIIQKIGFDINQGTMIHFNESSEDPKYKWYYILFGVKGGFKNETPILLPNSLLQQ